MAQPLLADLGSFDVSKPVLTREQVGEILPHRNALALLDGVVAIDHDTMLLVGWKDVGSAEFWNSGHFPGNPILPGVVIVEACAQLSLIGYKTFFPEVRDRLVLFGGINGVKFRGAVKPGDRLILLSRVTSATRRGAHSVTQGVVNGKLVYEGEIFAVTP